MLAIIDFSVGNSQDLQVGQGVLAIGNPFGLDHTLTTGVVSALGRSIKSVTDRTIEGVIRRMIIQNHLNGVCAVHNMKVGDNVTLDLQYYFWVNSQRTGNHIRL